MKEKKLALRIRKSNRQVKKGVNSIKYFRCNFLSMINLESEIHGDIKPEHIQLLKRTPFGNLFMCFYEKKIVNKEVIKSTDDIISIMSTYSQDKDAFKMGEKWVKLTVDDVALTFGLPKRGKKVHPLPRNAKESMESDFVRRHFREDKLLIKKAIVNAIKRTVVLNGKTDQEDFVRLVILYMSATIFFPNSLGSIGWSFIQHIEDLNKMNKISWPTVIHEYLMTQVRKHHKNPTHVSGCVILLLYWFCEHVDIISPFESSESKYPRILRWSLHDLAKKMATQSLEELSDDKVSLELKDLSSAEKMLLDIEMEKKDKFGNGEELDETVLEMNKRLTIENIKLQKRINYLEKKVQLLQSGQVDNSSLYDEEIEEDNMLTEEKEEEQDTTEKLAVSPFLPPPEPISYQKPSFRSRTMTKKRVKDEGSDYEEESNQYKNSKRKKKEQNDVKQKEGQQEEIDIDNIPSPSSDSSPVKLGDLSSSDVIRYLDDKQKAVVQNFFLNATKSTIAWEDKVKRIFITGSDLEDLMFGGFIDYKVVDWYASNLPSKLPNYATKSMFFSALAWNFVRDNRIDNEKHTLVDIIANMDESVRFLFFPMNSSKTSKSSDGFHWTLLHFNRLSLEWSHYDSMLPRGINKPTKYAQEANRMKDRVIEAFNEGNLLKSGKQYPVDAKLTIMGCPQQGESVDCALYMCHFMKKVACSEVLAESIAKERMKRKRAKWAYKILSDPEKSWRMEVDQEESVQEIL